MDNELGTGAFLQFCPKRKQTKIKQKEKKQPTINSKEDEEEEKEEKEEKDWLIEPLMGK